MTTMQPATGTLFSRPACGPRLRPRARRAGAPANRDLIPAREPIARPFDISIVVPRRGGRRGSVLIYAIFLMMMLLGVTSLAIDYGRMQAIKTQMQRSADLTARGVLQNYVSGNAINWSNVSSTLGPAMASNTYNPVDANSGVQPTVTCTWGSWDPTAQAFTAGGSGTYLAMQVSVARTAANGNAVPLMFSLFNGLSGVRASCDISATAIAYLTPNVTTTQTVPGKADLWLAGMPAGSTASYNDTAANAPPVFAINVTPGSTVTFNATGMTSNTGSTGNIAPNGSSTVTHMSGSPDGNNNGCQNGIQTVTAPLSSLLGVFLTNAAPNTVTPPAAGLSYATQASKDALTNNNMSVQQPFFIGTGQPSAGWATKPFTVPANATRLYMGILDTYENNNNPGSLSVTTTTLGQVYLVQ